VILSYKQILRFSSIYTEKSLEKYMMLISPNNHLNVSSFELLYSMKTKLQNV
jgi:hypothetical protein